MLVGQTGKLNGRKYGYEGKQRHKPWCTLENAEQHYGCKYNCGYSPFKKLHYGQLLGFNMIMILSHAGAVSSRFILLKDLLTA